MSVRKVELIKPTLQYKDSYIELVEEFRSAGEPFIPWVLSLPYDDFPGLIQGLKDNEQGVGLRPGYASHSTFWLVDIESGKVLAVSNMRHFLTPYLERRGGHIGYGVRPNERRKGYSTLILSLTLSEAKKIGLDKALITCAKGNIASRKAIISNGGVFFNEEFLESDNEVIQRFWIEL